MSPYHTTKNTHKTRQDKTRTVIMRADCMAHIFIFHSSYSFLFLSVLQYSTTQYSTLQQARHSTVPLLYQRDTNTLRRTAQCGARQRPWTPRTDLWLCIQYVHWLTNKHIVIRASREGKGRNAEHGQLVVEYVDRCIDR